MTGSQKYGAKRPWYRRFDRNRPKVEGSIDLPSRSSYIAWRNRRRWCKLVTSVPRPAMPTRRRSWMKLTFDQSHATVAPCWPRRRSLTTATHLLPAIATTELRAPASTKERKRVRSQRDAKESIWGEGLREADGPGGPLKRSDEHGPKRGAAHPPEYSVMPLIGPPRLKWQSTRPRRRAAHRSR
jgi:hypothetical protein